MSSKNKITSTVTSTVEKINPDLERLQVTGDIEIKKWTVKFMLRFVVCVIIFLLLLLTYFVFTNTNSGGAISNSISSALKVLGVIVDAAIK